MKKSLCFRKCSVNPSTEYSNVSTHYQSDFLNLNQRTNQPTAYSRQPIASIRSVGIGTCFIAVLFSAHYLVAQTSIGEQDKDRLEVVGYRLEETEGAFHDAIVENCKLLTLIPKSKSDENLLNPALMGGTGNLTTTAARWLFKTGSNRGMTMPFVGLGNAIEAPSRDFLNFDRTQPIAYSLQPTASVRPIGRIVSSAVPITYHLSPTTYHLSPTTSHLSPLTFTRPLAFRPITRSFSSVPPIKDNTLNSASADLSQNKKTIEELKEDVDKGLIACGIIEGKAATAQREESVKLFEEANKANQNVIGFQEQYIVALQEARAKAPLEAQAGWDRRIESAQNRRVLMVFRMRYHDINKAMVIAFIAEEKALAAQGEESVKLLDASRKATQDALEIQDQCIASLQEAREKAPLTAKEELTQHIEVAQYRRATMAYSAITKKADKLNDIFINAYNKAPLIKGEKDVRFWGQSKQLAQSLLEEVDLYITFLQNVQKKASVATKTDWKQHIEDANHKRIDVVCSVYTQKILEADAIDHVAHHKASTAQGEEAVKLWEASKQTSQVVSELRGQYIKVLQEIQEKAPLEMKLALKQSIAMLQYENAETIYNVFVKEVSKLGIISTMSYEKAAAAQEEEAVNLWTESKEAAQALLEAQDQYMKVLQEVKAKAPRETQKTWTRRIDIAQEDRATMICSVCSREVYRLNAVDRIAEAKLLAAPDVEALKLGEESKQVSEELIAAQDHYIEALQKAMAIVSETSRAELMQGMEEVCEERILTVCSILKKEVFKANVIATIAHDKAGVAQGSEAIRLWEEAKQADQVLLETHDHYIKALKEAEEKASLATKSEWNQRIEEAENIRPSIVSSALDQEAKRVAAIASVTQDKAASDKDVINDFKK